MTALEQLPVRIDDLTLQIVQLREEMHVEFSAIQTKLRAGDEEMRTLRIEMRTLRDDVMGQARMLYEDMKATLALMREDWT